MNIVPPLQIRLTSLDNWASSCSCRARFKSRWHSTGWRQIWSINMYFYVQHEPTCTKISRPTTCTLYMYINCQICARWLSNSPEMAYIYYTQNSFMLSPCPARFGLVFQSGEQMCVRRPMLYIFLCQSFTDKNSHGRQTGDCHPTRSLSMYDCR